MISVTQEFKNSCNSDYVLTQFKIQLSSNKSSAVLCTLNGDEFNISTGSIEKEASSGAACNIGGVCSNRIKVTLNQKGIEKVSNVNGFKKNYVMHLIQWNKVADANQSTVDYSLNLNGTENQTGKCDLGYYYIAEIENNYYDCNITGYDGMIAFEKALTVSQLKYMRNHKKTVDDWLNYLCGIVRTSNFDIYYRLNGSVTCNDGVTFQLSEDSDFETVREAVSHLAQLKMAYATIDVTGDLTLRKGINTSGVIDDTVANQYMYSCKNEIVESVVGYFYTSIAGFEYENVYSEEQGRNVVNLYLGENKFLRGNEPYNGTALSNKTLNCLRNMTQEIMGYSFYSCECEINERPYLELGDTISISKKYVNSQGTVITQTVPCVIDSLQHEIGVSTGISSNSTVSTSTSSGKNSVANSNVNSKAKEKSPDEVAKDIDDELTSDVTKYTDTTATIKIRLDSNEVTGITNATIFNSIDVTPTPVFTRFTDAYARTYYQAYMGNSAANDSRVYKNIYKKACSAYTNHKYIWSANYVNTLLNHAKIKYRILATRNDSVLQPLIGLTLPQIVDGCHLTVQITAIRTVTINNSRKDITADITAQHARLSRTYPYNSSYYTSNQVFGEVLSELTEEGVYSATKEVEFSNSADGVLGQGYWVESDMSYASRTDIDGNSHYVFDNVVNPYINHVTDYLLVTQLFGNFTYDCLVIANADNERYIGETFTNQQFNDVFSPGFSMQTSSHTLAEYQTELLSRANFINSFSGTINQAIDYIKGLITFTLDNYFIEVTYVTNSAEHPNPISDGDKKKVDDDIVTNEDVSGLESRVAQTESDVASLKSSIKKTNKQVNTNTQNISSHGNAISALQSTVQNNSSDITSLQTTTQGLSSTVSGLSSTVSQHTSDISSLDTRVTALEQGGGGGGSTTLSGLTDVNLNNPSQGQVLGYDATNNKWVNVNQSGGTNVVANPSGAASSNLNKLQVGSTIYAIPSGGGGTFTPTVYQVQNAPQDSVGNNYDIAILYEIINNVKMAIALFSKMLTWVKVAVFRGIDYSEYTDAQNVDYTVEFDDVVGYANFSQGTGNSGAGIYQQGTITVFVKTSDSGTETQLVEGTDYTLTWLTTGRGSTTFLLEYAPGTYLHSIRVHFYNCYRVSAKCEYLKNNQTLYNELNTQ